MTIERILDKLSKLKAAQEGEAAIGNAAAAEAFASAINRMLLQHELSMSDVPLSTAKEELIVEVLVSGKEHGIKFSRVRVGWQEALASIVAKAHLCKFLVTTGTNFITFVGTHTNAMIAGYAYGVLASAADRMSMTAREEWWKKECGGRHVASGGFRQAWLQGFIKRISERFEEAKQAEVQTSANAGTALMRLSNQLTRVAKHVDEKYKTKAAATSPVGGNNSAGVRAGREAADRVALGRKGVDGAAQVRIGGKA